LELSLSKAAAGDLRLAALVRIHLGRVRRALRDDASDRAALAKVFRRPSTRSTKCPGWSSGSSRFLMRPTPPARLPSSRLHWTRALTRSPVSQPSPAMPQGLEHSPPMQIGGECPPPLMRSRSSTGPPAHSDGRRRPRREC
jgi:hypothetical protein